MTSRASTTRQRSLFCECNKSPCQCWPSTSTSTRPRTQSRSQPQPPAVATLWPHYNVAQAQQLPSPHTPAGSYASPSAGSQHSPNPGSYPAADPATSPSLAVPAYPPASSPNMSTSSPNMSTSSPRSPLANQIQLHSLFKAPSILRTPESPSTFRVQWDVRDSPTSSVILSNHEPEYLYEHPAGAAYATSPPVPYLLIACDDALPWLTPVHAKPGSAGVTVRDVLEAISAVLYMQVEASTLQQLPNDEARSRVYQAYYSRVERNGADNKGILAVDYLGDKSLFVCLERNEALARKRVKEESMWPYVFALKLKMRKGALVSDA